MEKLEGIELILFDMEVYKYDWIAGFKIHNTGEYIQIHNEPNDLELFLIEHSDAIYFTINGERYDDNILDGILKGKDPYAISQAIIKYKKDLRAWNLPIVTYDLSKQKTFYPSLKAFESNNGMSIEELPIDPDLDRHLTQEEIDTLMFYNRHDLDATELSMTQRMSESIMIKARLIKYFGLDFKRWIARTTVSIAANGLGAKKGKHPHQAFSIDGLYSTLDLKNEEVLDHLLSERFYDEDLVIEIAGITHHIKKGGIHAAKDDYYETEDLWHVDFDSYYPSIMIEYDLLSRSLDEEGREKFIQVRSDRYEAKANKDKDTDIALKTVINSMFGAANSEYSPLYDPSRATLVCMYGQAFAIDLTEKLEHIVEMIQSNTDGIIFKLKDPSYEQEMRDIIKAFEERTRLKMSIEHYSKICQKDVNNYVALFDGKVESKGGMTNLWDLKPQDAHYRGTYRMLQTTVIDKAVTLNLLYNKPVEDTILEEFQAGNWFRFQGTSKVGKMYHKVCLVEEHRETEEQIKSINLLLKDKEIKKLLQGTRSKKNPDPGFNIKIKNYLEFIEQYEDDVFDEIQLEVLETLGIVPIMDRGQELEVQHINRVFASKDDGVTRTLYKYKWVPDKVHGGKKISKALIPNLPKNVFVYNGNMDDFNQEDKIDLNYYIEEAQRKVDFYKGLTK